MKYFSLLTLLCLNCSLFACINLYSHYEEPTVVGESALLDYWFRAPSQGELVKKIQKIETQLNLKYSDSLYSDYGANLLYLGYYKEGLHVFQQLIVRKQREYQIIQNLGTAYELNGQLDSALFYIQKGLKINPESHRGSEWIHVKILEAEIAAKKDTNFLKTHLNLLGLPTAPNANKDDVQIAEKNVKILRQLNYQLTERLPFTMPPNPIMGAIFYELGKFYYHFDEEESYKSFRVALWYGFTQPDSAKKEQTLLIKALQKRDKSYYKNPERIIHKDFPKFMIDSGYTYTPKFFSPPVIEKPKSSFLNSIIYVILVMSICMLGFLFWRKKE